VVLGFCKVLIINGLCAKFIEFMLNSCDVLGEMSLEKSNTFGIFATYRAEEYKYHLSKNDNHQMTQKDQNFKNQLFYLKQTSLGNRTIKNFAGIGLFWQKSDANGSFDSTHFTYFCFIRIINIFHPHPPTH